MAVTPSGRAATSTRRATASPSCARPWRPTSTAWYGIEVDPEQEVLVTVGATEAIAATMLALCEPGDEVVMFEPTYDSYAATASMAGAVPRLVRLHPPDWHFDPDELAAAVGPRTKMVLLNSPHNPTGKVFSPEELAQVAALCAAHDLLAVTDEVYEHLVFDGRTSRWPPCPAWASAPSPSRRAARRSPSPGGRWAG